MSYELAQTLQAALDDGCITTATASNRLNRFIRCTTFNGPDADTRFDC